MKRWILAVAALLGAGAALAGGLFHAPPPDVEMVATRRLGSTRAELVEPGVHWRVPLLVRVLRYPPGPRDVSLSIRSLPGAELRSAEGAGIRISADVRLKPDPGRIGVLDTGLGEAWSDPALLGGAAAAAIAPALRGIAYDALLSGEPAPARALEAALTQGLAAAGLTVESLTALRAWPEIALPSEDPGARRLLLVGLDGADWRLIDPLMERGLLPNLEHIVRGGVRARLRTIAPMLSPIIWTSIATGKGPEKHGIMDFLAVDSRTGKQMPVTSSMRTARAFWQILSLRGVSVGTIGWWATWPAEPVLGFQVTDRVAYQLFGAGAMGEGLRGRTSPEALILSLSPDFAEAESRAATDLVDLLGRPPDPAVEDEAALRQILLSTRTYHHAALSLLKTYRPRVAAVYYEGTDTVAHLFMKYAPPRMAGVTAEEVERWGGVVERFYLLQDRLLGELLREAGGESVVMIVSDHGFKSGASRPQTDPRIGVGMAADWHHKFGVLAVAGPGIAGGRTLSDVSVLDITPTMLALLGLPAAEDMDGRVIEELMGSTEIPAPVASYEGGQAPPAAPAETAGPASEAVAEEIIAKLTALGYIGQTTPNASNNAGITLLQQGRVAEAEQAFRRAFEQDPGFLPARLNIARALMAGGSPESALTELRAVRKADPGIPEVDNLIGNVLLEMDDVAGAERTFREALRKDPTNPHLWNSLGIVLARRGKSGEALEAYREVERIDADYAEAINNAGLVMRETGRRKEAIATFERAIRSDPGFAGSYNNLGLTHQDGGDFRAALAAYDRGLEVDPENAVIWNNRGSALLAMGLKEEARDAFARAVEADPDYPSAHNNLGAVLGMLGDHDAELDEYLKAIDLDPGYTDARLNLALNLIRGGRLREAERALRQILELDPGSARARLELGIVLVSLGEEAEGLRELERLRDDAPSWTAPRNALARIHRAGGRAARALEEARASLAIDPDQPEMREIVEAEGRATSGSRP